jgi:hypothetical protein
VISMPLSVHSQTAAISSDASLSAWPAVVIADACCSIRRISGEGSEGGRWKGRWFGEATLAIPN